MKKVLFIITAAMVMLVLSLALNTAQAQDNAVPKHECVEKCADCKEKCGEKCADCKEKCVEKCADCKEKCVEKCADCKEKCGEKRADCKEKCKKTATKKGHKKCDHNKKGEAK